jgi:hypothetical protein
VRMCGRVKARRLGLFREFSVTDGLRSICKYIYHTHSHHMVRVATFVGLGEGDGPWEGDT